MTAPSTSSSSSLFRVEKDSLGQVNVPINALYSAQTQRALENFPFPLEFPEKFLIALAHVKKACAQANQDLKLMDSEIAESIKLATDQVIQNFSKYSSDFPLSIFQTGSGTSTNMNMNEVLSTLATRHLGSLVHPNDHVNMSQSSNDVIPTAMNVAAALEAQYKTIPSLIHLRDTLLQKANENQRVVKTGRTHLMDAMPITLGQELSGWAEQISKGIERIKSALNRVVALAIGGTAVGTGINADPEFGQNVATILSSQLSIPFSQNSNLFEALSSADAIVELSSQLKVVAVSLMKISNDLRWMNSGPIGGLGEIVLPSLQPGSSIMPGKINPVIPEAVGMVCAQVIGNDTTITIAGQSGSFQLNTMLPILSYNILQSESLIAQACEVLADKAIVGFTVNEEKMQELVHKNPILVTALNPLVGYELGAKIAKTAYAQGRMLKDVAGEMTNLSQDELQKQLDPYKLTQGGVAKK